MKGLIVSMDIGICIGLICYVMLCYVMQARSSLYANTQLRAHRRAEKKIKSKKKKKKKKK